MNCYDGSADFTIGIEKCEVLKTEAMTSLLIADSKIYLELRNKLSDKLTVNVRNCDTRTFGHFKFNATSSKGALIFSLFQLFVIDTAYQVKYHPGETVPPSRLS